MGIQDLGAIGEFVSSIVIVVTLVVLVYEVRGSKQATLRANAQERKRQRNETTRSIVESPDLSRILTTANEHLGLSQAEVAAAFGLDPDEYRRLAAYNVRMLAQWSDAYGSELPEDERAANDGLIRYAFSLPSFSKWYDLTWAGVPRPRYSAAFFEHVEEIRASLQPVAD